MTTIALNGTEYKSPAFAYAGGVAQATYEHGATELVVRKAGAAHEAPLTDRNQTEFAQKWTKTYEGIEVTLYGATQNGATVATWKEGTQDYGVTFQGLGGEEVTMTSDEVDAIVKGMKEANAATVQASRQSASAQGASAQNAGGMISGDQAARIAEQVSGGTLVGSPQLVQTENYGQCYLCYTVDQNQNTNGYYVDANGNAYLVEESKEQVSGASQMAISGDQAARIAEQTSGGTLIGSPSLVQTDSYGPCYLCSTVDQNQNVSTYYVDANGNAYLVEQSAEGAANNAGAAGATDAADVADTADAADANQPVQDAGNGGNAGEAEAGQQQ